MIYKYFFELTLKIEIKCKTLDPDTSPFQKLSQLFLIKLSIDLVWGIYKLSFINYVTWF
jgi:hypothetical protein